MRRLMLLSAIVGVLAAPASAGTLAYAEGHGTWKSTMCVLPPRPEALRKDAEENANSLNEQILAYNQYTEQVKAYMECVSREAERDSSGAQQTTATDAQRAINAAQQELQQIQGQLKSR